ncbi:Protein Brevis radix-like 3 [Hibiscus syriacus]|uniref:Protein Brevis radix-like 3 n=1 Tax=Hibiscus syriacus TaxID=106335 RepID=A0A6A2X176_HIBSY|nr:Protein Brevis radix-like 3 [Hibiscus syriacus]
MLTCVTCSKQLNNNGGSVGRQQDEDTLETPRTRQAVKALTSQIKDIALKASRAYKNCKPCSGSSNHNRNYADSDAASDSEHFYCPYRRTGRYTPRNWGKEMESRLKGLSSAEGTPTSVSGRTESVVFMEEDEAKEWVSKWQAQRWWSENYDKAMELYNVQRLNHQAAPLSTPSRSEDEGSRVESVKDSPVTPPMNKEQPRNFVRPTGMGYSSLDSLDHHPVQSRQYYDSAALASTPKLSSISGAKTQTSSVDGSVRSSSSREDYSGEPSISNASDIETEWVEQDEPGVYLTIRALPGGSRELKRVRFSRERFGEMEARMWWEENRARIRQHYLL